jgi:hypothetical protein
MQGTLRLHLLLYPIRLRLVRKLRASLTRYLRARLREESPVLDRIGREVRPLSGFHIRERM